MKNLVRVKPAKTNPLHEFKISRVTSLERGTTDSYKTWITATIDLPKLGTTAREIVTSLSTALDALETEQGAGDLVLEFELHDYGAEEEACTLRWISLTGNAKPSEADIVAFKEYAEGQRRDQAERDRREYDRREYDRLKQLFAEESGRLFTGKRSCPLCGGTRRWKTLSTEVKYKEQSMVVNTTAWWCDACGDAILNGEALEVFDLALAELKARVEGTSEGGNNGQG